MARRENPETVAWIVGGAVVLGLGYLVYQMSQNQANQANQQASSGSSGSSGSGSSVSSDITAAGNTAGSLISQITGGGSGS